MMPVLRSGARRGRPPKQNRQRPQPKTPAVGDAIATRTRRRRAAALAVNDHVEEEPIAVEAGKERNENVDVAATEKGEEEENRALEEAGGVEKEEIGEKQMVGIDSVGHSNDKADDADGEEESAFVIPEKVSYSFT
jgi:hypothetical protein